DIQHPRSRLAFWPLTNFNHALATMDKYRIINRPPFQILHVWREKRFAPRRVSTGYDPGITGKLGDITPCDEDVSSHEDLPNEKTTRSRLVSDPRTKGCRENAVLPPYSLPSSPIHRFAAHLLTPPARRRTPSRIRRPFRPGFQRSTTPV